MDSEQKLRTLELISQMSDEKISLLSQIFENTVIKKNPVNVNLDAYKGIQKKSIKLMNELVPFILRKKEGVSISEILNHLKSIKYNGKVTKYSIHALLKKVVEMNKGIRSEIINGMSFFFPTDANHQIQRKNLTIRKQKNPSIKEVYATLASSNEPITVKQIAEKLNVRHQQLRDTVYTLRTTNRIKRVNQNQPFTYEVIKEKQNNNEPIENSLSSFV